MKAEIGGGGGYIMEGGKGSIGMSDETTEWTRLSQIAYDNTSINVGVFHRMVDENARLVAMMNAKPDPQALLYEFVRCRRAEHDLEQASMDATARHRDVLNQFDSLKKRLADILGTGENERLFFLCDGSTVLVKVNERGAVEYRRFRADGSVLGAKDDWESA